VRRWSVDGLSDVVGAWHDTIICMYVCDGSVWVFV
jgi:hypothetical protein